MAINNLETITWKIEKFSCFSVDGNKSPNSLPNKQFYLWLESKVSEIFSTDCVTVYLSRNKPYSENFNVEWKISVIDHDGNKRNIKVSNVVFTAKRQNQPVCGGLYFINRDYLLDPTNGLIMNDTLTLHCEIKTINNVKNMEPLENSQLILENKKLLKDYESLLESCKHSDVLFVVGKKEFKLHKAILSARSPVFAAMFDSDLSENKQNRVDIPDVEVEVFEELVGFIYTGKLPSMDQYALELFVASDKYQFESIKELSGRSLGDNLSIESLASVLTLADMHSANELKSKCVDFFIKNSTKVMKTENWKKLSKTKHDLAMELFEEFASKAEPLLK